MSLCRLCKKEASLQDSHIIPKFIGNWIKKTSATGYFRSIDNPNIRRQDFPTVKLLCKTCEDIFSNNESCFAKQIFHPYVKREFFSYTLPYNHQVAKFCASLSWRVLVYTTEFLKISKNEVSLEIEQYKLKLEKFLLGEVSNLDQYEQHLIPAESFIQKFLEYKSSNVHSYFTRAIDTDILYFRDGTIIYVKIPGFFILSNINYKNINKLRRSRVSLKNGILLKKEYVIPQEMYKYLYYKLQFIKENVTDKISSTQNQKMIETIKKDLDRLEKSHTIKIIEASLYPNNYIFRDKTKPL